MSLSRLACDNNAIRLLPLSRWIVHADSVTLPLWQWYSSPPCRFSIGDLCGVCDISPGQLWRSRKVSNQDKRSSCSWLKVYDCLTSLQSCLQSFNILHCSEPTADGAWQHTWDAEPFRLFPKTNAKINLTVNRLTLLPVKYVGNWNTFL